MKTITTLIAAVVVLALAGCMIQRLTGNPMASPEVLGISAGAALGLIVLLVGIQMGLELFVRPSDLFGFAPTFALLSALGFLIALPLANWLARRMPPLRWLIFVLAALLILGEVAALAGTLHWFGAPPVGATAPTHSRNLPAPTLQAA